MDNIPATDSIRVLCVDDNPEDIAIIRRLLGQFQRASFDVASASTTSGCLERLDSDGADVLLLDHSLPGEDGVSFLRRLSATRNIPPVIVLTGRGDERLAVEAIRSGAADYFPKDGITPSNLGGALLRAIDSFRESEEREVLDEQIVVALADAAEGKDPTTAGHLQRLPRYAVLLGQEIGLADEQLQMLHYGALLHDIGKLAVSHGVLCKPGPLNEEEWEEIRQHPLVGERICACLWLSRQVNPIIRHHHERWDGAGYVDGLAGADIPILARVVSIVDAFDAMSSDRPYRRALPQRVVMKRLSDGAGKQWDPDIIQAFLDLSEREHLGSDHEHDTVNRNLRAA
jgi:putative two-component system response regulator